MARSSEKATLLNSSPAEEKLAWPLGLVSPGVRPYLELIRFHKVCYLPGNSSESKLTLDLAHWHYPCVLAVRYVAMLTKFLSSRSY
jgi:hypothetical protein